MSTKMWIILGVVLVAAIVVSVIIYNKKKESATKKTAETVPVGTKAPIIETVEKAASTGNLATTPAATTGV